MPKDIERYGLGRWNWPDERDQQYAMPRVEELPRESRVWSPGEILDQGRTPMCVAYAWKQLLLTTPVKQGQDISEDFVYYWCQENDEWPGQDYDGTSVRAGAKCIGSLGYLEEYRWAWSAQDAVAWLLDHGPVVLGTAWFTGMFTPRPDGVVTPSGDLSGGHAYLAIGYEHEWEAVVCVNSWGESWGRDGIFYLWAPHLDWLLQNGGEACAPTEVLLDSDEDDDASEGEESDDDGAPESRETQQERRQPALAGV